MAITYTWDTKSVDTYPTKSGKSDVIFKVYWELTGVDDTEEKNLSSSTGVAEIDTSDLSSFTEFADLKESDVTGWVQTSLGTDQINHYKSVIEEVIQEKATPTVVRKYISE
tara:strand:+ start:3698 stop:4030 length:333 start_codon:yes stop_codon:yes gene_type:complete